MDSLWHASSSFSLFLCGNKPYQTISNNALLVWEILISIRLVWLLPYFGVKPSLCRRIYNVVRWKLDGRLTFIGWKHLCAHFKSQCLMYEKVSVTLVRCGNAKRPVSCEQTFQWSKRHPVKKCWNGKYLNIWRLHIFQWRRRNEMYLFEVANKWEDNKSKYVDNGLTQTL